MKALELLKSQSPLLLEDGIQGKKTKIIGTTLNQLLLDMNEQITSFEQFCNSQRSGDLANKIIIAKSLAEYFAGNKLLKVELAVEGLRNQEKAQINEYYSVKTKLLDTIRSVIKESAKEAVVSNYDIFEGNFVKCEPGHEIIILGERNLNVLKTLLKELDEELTIEGNFESIESQPVDFNLNTLNRNVELCSRKANEIFGAKAGKLNKVESFIAKFEEIGKQVVVFYTYKTALLEIGCSEKGVRDYEHELSKAYVPLKKTLSKELKVELEDICLTSINESEYPTYNVEDSVSEIPSLDNVFENTPSIDNSLFTEPKESSFEENNSNPFDTFSSNNTSSGEDDSPKSPFANSPFFTGNDDNNF